MEPYVFRHVCTCFTLLFSNLRRSWSACALICEPVFCNCQASYFSFFGLHFKCRFSNAVFFFSLYAASSVSIVNFAPHLSQVMTVMFMPEPLPLMRQISLYFPETCKFPHTSLLVCLWNAQHCRSALRSVSLLLLVYQTHEK